VSAILKNTLRFVLLLAFHTNFTKTVNLRAVYRQPMHYSSRN